MNDPERATPPAFQATSIYALRFGNQQALPFGQCLLGQKGPIRGGSLPFSALYCFSLFLRWTMRALSAHSKKLGSRL